MENNATSDTTSTPVAATDSSVQAQVNTQAGQTETGTNEESFFDPNQVPEQLKPAYKQMQADYTRKTQTLAAERKQAEEWKAKAEAYAKYEKYVPILEEMVGSSDKAQTVSPEMAALESQLKQAGYSDEAIEMMKIGAQFTLSHFNKTLEGQREAERVERGVTAAEQLDPRLSDDTRRYDLGDGEEVTFGEIVARFVGSDSNWKNDPIKATQRAIKTVDALIGKAKQEGKEELSAAAKEKASKFPQIKSSPQSALDGSKAVSMREAAEQAKQQLGI